LSRGETSAALEIFEKSFSSQRGNTYDGLQAALAADVLGQTQRRDLLLKRVKTASFFDRMDSALASLMLDFVSQPEGSQWNEDEFRRIMTTSNAGGPTNYYYFAGRFLELRGRNEQGQEYLRLAASSPQIERFNCLLATLELRRREAEIPARRPIELGGGLAEFSPIKDEIEVWEHARQFDRVVESITEFRSDHEDWTFLLVERGQAYENLGNFEQAIADYKLAIERRPDFEDAHHRLAMIRAACEDPAFRDPAEALVHAQRALELGPQTYINLTSLAVAYAANGQFDKAVEYQTGAWNDLPQDSKKEAEQRLNLFKEKKPYVREPKPS
jgi:tetratricopeptide (TPR) repeat protein